MSKQTAWIILIVIIFILGIGGYFLFFQENEEIINNSDVIATTNENANAKVNANMDINVNKGVVHTALDKMLVQVNKKDIKGTWLVNTAAGKTQKIIDLNELSNHGSPALSPDGKFVAYKSSGIKMIDLSSEEITIIDSMTDGERNTGLPYFSPNGIYLAYMLIDESSIKINLYDFTKKEAQELARIGREQNVDNFKSDLTWSPDSKKIVFIYNNSIYSVDIDGTINKVYSDGDLRAVELNDGGTKQIFSITGAQYSNLQNVIYIQKYQTSSDGKNGINNTFSVDLDSGEVEQLTDKDTNPERYIYNYGLTPDESGVIFMETWPLGQDPNMAKVILYNINNRTESAVYEGEDLKNPYISPDGLYFGLSRFNNTTDEPGIYLLEIDSGQITQLTDLEGYILDWK